MFLIFVRVKEDFFLGFPASGQDIGLPTTSCIYNHNAHIRLCIPLGVYLRTYLQPNAFFPKEINIV